MAEADLILTNGHIVTMDDDYRLFPHGAIAIREGEIVAVGTSEAIESESKGAEAFDCGGKAVIPGLINAHTHAAMTLLRGLADDRRLDVWLLGYIMPVEREFVTPEFCRLGTQLACAEMIRGGITFFADMYYFEETVAETVADVGMRAICSQTVLKFPSPDAESFEDSLAYAREFIHRWRGHPLVVPSIAPHAPYTCTEEILQSCTDLAIEFDVPLHIHLSETAQEVEQWRETYDMPVIPWVKKLGLFEAKVLAAHCVHIDGGEIHTLLHAGAGVAHNPSSNLKIASGFAPVTQMLQEGIHLGLGTDGTASNNDLDMFEELRLASFVAKATSGDPTAAPARTTLAMATRLGAKAVHLDHLIGSIEVGKRADFAIIDIDTLHSRPHFSHDPNAIYSQLLYTAKSTDVTEVMVNGTWLMRDRKLLTIETDDLLAEAADYARRIDAFLIEREDSVLSKLIAIGGAAQEESYEVQIKLRLPEPEAVISRLGSDNLEIVRAVHYREYDTYFTFDDPDQGRLRYREDEFIDEAGQVHNVRYRLTMIGPAAEREYPKSVLLSRSRLIAPATHSPRFYREYFNPSGEIEIHKDRMRWLIRFRDKEFFINIDALLKPTVEGSFLEIKTRTWSRRDAEEKASLILDLLSQLGVEGAEEVREEYPDFIGEAV